MPKGGVLMLNSCTIQGRLAADPQLRQTTSGKSVCSFRIACTRNFGKDLETDWLDCVAWGQTGEFVSKYFQKGAQILLQGNIQTRQYQDKNGNNRKAVEINAERVFFCGGKQALSATDTPVQSRTVPSLGASEFSGSFAPIEEDEDLPF